MKTILAPVDFSAVTPRVVAEAAALASAMNGRLVLCSVTEPAVGVVDYAIVVMATAGIDEAAVKRAREGLASYAAEISAGDGRVETVQLNGSPVPEIVELAAKLPADYIVMGSHGHSALRHLLAGGTASGVLKGVRCPVVIVPAVTPEQP